MTLTLNAVANFLEQQKSKRIFANTILIELYESFIHFSKIKSIVKTDEELEVRFNKVYPPELTDGLPNINACKIGFKEGYLACLEDIQNELQ